MRICTFLSAALVLIACLGLTAGCSPVQSASGPSQAQAGQPVPPAAAPAATLPPAAAPSGGPVRHTVAKPTVDPIVANGPIFADWPKPDLAIMISGELDGYMEPCGCAGLENMLGGLKRRHSLIKQLQQQGWPLVELDMGGLVKRRGPQSEIKYRHVLEAYAEMGYDAVALGAHELLLDNVDALAGTLMNLDPAKNPVVSANVGVYGLDESVEAGMSDRYRVIEAGGKRVGVTAVLGAAHQESLKNRSDVAVIAPLEALQKVAPQLAAEKCDLQVLMVHGTPQEAADLARQFPQFQIVGTTGGAEEPPAQPRKAAGTSAIMVETGHKGMYVVVIGLFKDPAQPVRYQRVPLDIRFPDSPEMQARLVAYQKELEIMTLKGLGLTGMQHPDGDFAGSAACADCHSAAWEVFEKTTHSHALDTLVNLKPPRHFDPECIACHVTGWRPQEYAPYTTGYLSIDETPDMQHVGCEDCHGPAAAHVKVESGEVTVSDEEQEALRMALRMTIVANEGSKDGQRFGRVVKNCMQCHDLDNSPDFDFQTYWPKVAHEGKE